MEENQTLAYTSPLYGRRTGQIKLKQISFQYYHEFFPGKSRKELIEYYAVTGGVPKYIELFYDSPDIYTAIENNVLSKSGFLYDEPNFLLQREVGEVGSYFSVIKTIAAGNRKLSKIAAVLGLKQTGITKYLKTLTGLDILERNVPVTEENPEKSKRGRYKIWWNHHVEIDIVALDRESNHIIFGECKYRADKTGLNVLRDLEQKSAQVEWKREERKNHFILFSMSGFTDELTELSRVRNDLVLMS